MSNHPKFAMAYEDYVQGATLEGVGGFHEPILSGIGPVGQIANLQDMRLSKPWGYSGASNFRVRPLWGNPLETSERRPIQIISLLDVRVGDMEELLSVGYLDGGGAPVSVAYFGFADLSPPTSDFLFHAHFLLPEPVLAHGVSVAFTGTSSITIGRVWAGPLWIPEFGIQSTWESSVIDPGEMGLSRGRQGYPRRRQRGRKLDVQLDYVPFATAFGVDDDSVLDVQQIAYRVGTTEPVIMFPRTRDGAGDIDTHAIHRLGVYGHLTDPVTIRHAGGDNFSARLVAQELF